MSSILITGRGGNAGSWAVRAVQLGAAIGAEVQDNAEVSDCRSARVVVGVKRVPDDLLRRIKSSLRFFVWDAVDAYPQPGGNRWSRDQCMDWLANELKRLRPNAIVWPTVQMMRDAAWNGPQIVLPHHAWPKYQPAPIRQSVQSVGYEGEAHYLGRWAKVLETECARRGWRLVLGDLSQCDIGVALRDVSGYAPKHWKPATKLTNLQALGIPALCSVESGYKEQSSGAEYWIEHPDDITRAFNDLTDPDLRTAISAVQQPHAYRLEQAATDYGTWLRQLEF